MLFVAALATCKGGTTININREICEKKIIFQDDFDGKDIYSKWRHIVRFAGYPVRSLLKESPHIPYLSIQSERTATCW